MRRRDLLRRMPADDRALDTPRAPRSGCLRAAVVVALCRLMKVGGNAEETLRDASRNL
jgi:hypothetical protein